MEKFKVNILGCGAAIPIGIRKIRVKWQIWRGQAIDIWSKSAYPADVLSNLCSNGFRTALMVLSAAVWRVFSNH